MNLLEQNIDLIKEICRQYRVKTLFAFGSVTKDRLTPESDFDFVVDIESSDPLIYAENYFELKSRLERILKRKVDLLEQKAINNSFLRNEIDRSKVLLYEN